MPPQGVAGGRMRLLAAALPRLDWRSPRLPLVVISALLAGLLLALLGSASIGLLAPIRYAGLPEATGALPLPSAARSGPAALFGLDSPASPAPGLSGPAADPAAPPLDVDPALIERRGDLLLPRIAEDGRTPRAVFARAAPLPAIAPSIAILVAELGLDGERLRQSVALPGEMALAHTPYAAHLPSWQRHARWHGHEVLLELPLLAHDHPASDLGPWTIRPADPPAGQIAMLERVLARGEGYFGLAAASEAFSQAPERFAPVAEALAGRGLGFVELGGTHLETAAAAAGLAYASAVGPLDAVPDPRAIDAALGELETMALRDGTALGYVQAYPLSFDRLWHWSRTLAAKGITLVPASQLLPVP